MINELEIILLQSINDANMNDNKFRNYVRNLLESAKRNRILRYTRNGKTKIVTTNQIVHWDGSIGSYGATIEGVGQVPLEELTLPTEREVSGD